jgi:hypothetical protein
VPGIAALALLAGMIAGIHAADAQNIPANTSAADAFTSLDVGFAEGGTPAQLPQWLDAMDTYVGDKKPIIRLDLDWWYVQPSQTGALHWDHLDPLVDAAAARGMRVLLVVAYSPPWANGHPGEGGWFPTSDADWTSIVARTVAHFGGKVAAYEVWNEPNQISSGNYGSGGTAERKQRYWQLVQLAYQQVHAGCAGCVVLAGGSAYGTPSTPQLNENESAAWLEWGYAHGYGGSFDAVAHHPYPAANSGFGPDRPECTVRWWNMFGPPDPRCGELAAVRAVMVNHGDQAKKIWATEWGYPTAGNTGLPLETVRDHQVEGVHMWRSLNYTGPLFLYSFRDQSTWSGAPCSTLPDNAECHFGVADAAGTPKEPLYTDLSRKLDDNWPDGLSTGQGMRRWAALRSTDGRFFLWLTGAGGLALYKVGLADPIWTNGSQGAVRMVNQPDGNLVLYTGADTPAWSTGTWSAGPASLYVQNDGNVVLYRTSDGAPVWSTNTWRYGS